MSTHKAGGASSQHVSPSGKRLGPKVASGQKVGIGEILVRQRGGTVLAGDGVKRGRDHTLYSMTAGKVLMKNKQGRKTISIQSN